jgi:hypothetical protein
VAFGSGALIASRGVGAPKSRPCRGNSESIGRKSRGSRGKRRDKWRDTWRDTWRGTWRGTRKGGAGGVAAAAIPNWKRGSSTRAAGSVPTALYRAYKLSPGSANFSEELDAVPASSRKRTAH